MPNRTIPRGPNPSWFGIAELLVAGSVMNVADWEMHLRTIFGDDWVQWAELMYTSTAYWVADTSSYRETAKQFYFFVRDVCTSSKEFVSVEVARPYFEAGIPLDLTKRAIAEGISADIALTLTPGVFGAKP